MGWQSVGYTYLKEKYSRISNDKVKEEKLFAQIKELVLHEMSEEPLNEVENSVETFCGTGDFFRNISKKIVNT